jgi:hypothetical protein
VKPLKEKRKTFSPKSFFNFFEIFKNLVGHVTLVETLWYETSHLCLKQRKQQDSITCLKRFKE